MIITFCGHSDFIGTEKLENKLLAFLSEKVGDESADMYLGGYGAFDSFAYSCCKKYKSDHPKTKLVFVTPYLTQEYQRNHLEYIKAQYDEIIYPPIEDKPLKFAISYRNKYMTENADFVIAYITRARGGAYMTYKHAKRKGKAVINLADRDFD